MLVLLTYSDSDAGRHPGVTVERVAKEHYKGKEGEREFLERAAFDMHCHHLNQFLLNLHRLRHRHTRAFAIYLATKSSISSSASDVFNLP